MKPLDVKIERLNGLVYFQSPTCAPGFQLGPDCACECANGEDAQNCQGGYRVSQHTSVPLP